MRIPSLTARPITRRAGAALAAIALAPLAAIALANTASASRVAAASTPICSTSGTDGWIDTTGNGAAGSIYYTLELTNLSGHTCTITGYPGVSAVDLAGHQLGSAASRDAVHAPRPATLVNGATATAVLRIVQAANYPVATCKKTTAAGLRVYPPGQTAAKIVPFPFQACSRPGPTFLSIEAAQKS
jgi:hypothetical protein